ncbi:hypothetical protein B5T_04332 [Alloalcanivorax dieselolei B5]|uniref:Cellulase n=1 Tax=Alcanivorax dieselolei (strain DSM 16502 / CGMCC 1.3690 / MCCC 1A00001 / B-5) TaxID=930169 RepID=K0CLC6_ALCDB|nr:cellulase-like family protein [Alloalcanivorax dieselolei]AFT72592.1 hypothetical protein B5T_04332 [Alloalcanivorax dieselolei B5]GGJ79011.1 hypothetical protein GCM10007426_05160 [Alloalcanivorax dieselolei]
MGEQEPSAGKESERLALACWDYAWPLASEYRSLDRVLDETVARGFNALRLDPFPHLLAAPARGVHMDRCELDVPADPRRDLSASKATIRIRRGVRRLLQGAADRGLSLWLHSHFLPDSRARRSFVRRPEDFVDVWAQTLGLMREWDLLDRVVAVDFCHQFPQPPAAHGLIRRVFGRSPERPLPRHWSEREERSLEAYLVEVPRTLRALFPGVRFGVSCGAGQSEYLRQMDTGELDFLELALWLDDDPRFRLASGERLPVPGRLGRMLAPPVRQLLMEATGEQWLRRLHDQLNRRLAFARLRRMEPVLGDGYLQVSRPPSSLPRGWAAFIESTVDQALTAGVSVMTPTSLARPQTAWLWQEQDWLEQLNRRIRAGG